MKNNKQIAIIGAGGHSKVVANIANLTGYEIVGYYDDLSIRSDILGKIEDADESISNYICAIGDNVTRRKIVENLKNVNWINLIHPFIPLAYDLIIGKGNTICPGVIVQPTVTIGDHSIINTNVSIDHDCRIGSFVHIAPGTTICGGVEVSDGTFIGAGTTIINNIKIGSNVIIGAGSNVIRDIPSNCKAYGNPCRIIELF